MYKGQEIQDWNILEVGSIRRNPIIVDFFRRMKYLERRRRKHLGYKNLTYFSRHFLKPLIEQGKLKLTIPEKPNSKMQKYVSE